METKSVPKAVQKIYFTPRESEVMQYVAEGQTSKEIAAALCVDKRTVDYHLANIFDKLQVSNRIQALNNARRLGLLA